MFEAVIFDLDDTLLDTSVVADARRGRNWAAVKAGLDHVRPFDSEGLAIESLPARLKDEGLKVGVLTHSPTWYSRTLIDRFGIETDALITGSDGYPPKPDPTSLKAIADELDVLIDACVYVGDLDTDAAAAAAAGATSVGVSWSKLAPTTWRRWWPDAAISKPERLLQLAEFGRLRPLAEAVLAEEEPLWHWGTIVRVEPGVGALGRYFTPEDVDRHPGHALSRLLLEAKDDPAKAAEVAEIFARLGERPSWGDTRPDMIASVPAKPGASFDRFEIVRGRLAEALGAREGGDLLTMKFDVENYKKLDHDARRQANEGRFEAAQLNEEHILLIDDVLTSGGQVDACRESLLEAGAAKVSVLALTATQDRLPEACPICGANLRTYYRYDGQPFIGCPNFFTALGCPYTRDI